MDHDFGPELIRERFDTVDVGPSFAFFPIELGKVFRAWDFHEIGNDPMRPV